MQKAFLLLLATALVLPAFADSEHTVMRITVEQLERTLAAAHGMPDKQVARQLSDMELTERLSELRRVHLDAELPGPEARQALMTLTEASAFFDLPAADIPSTPMPDRAMQTSLIAMARTYVLKTILKLPNFFATRETVNFEGAPAKAQTGSMPVGKFEPLHEASHSSVTVLYRDNKEMIAKEKGHGASARQLRTMGEFGPILVTVLNDAAAGRVIWSHWEQGAAGVMAVFHYAIPEQASHYLVASVNVEQGNQRDPAYHGEIAVDPADGSILRLTAIAEMKPDDPIVTADLLVDYGPEELGGMTYICPKKSVALSLVRMVVFERDFNTGAVLSSSLGAPRTYLNEVLFTQYHLFRAETRILSGNGEVPVTAPPAQSPQ